MQMPTMFTAMPTRIIQPRSSVIRAPLLASRVAQFDCPHPGQSSMRLLLNHMLRAMEAGERIGQKAEGEHRPYSGIVANSTAMLKFKRLGMSCCPDRVS